MDDLMPQGRILLKAISESRKLAALKTNGARLLYTWLIPHLDANGCFSGDPIVVNGKVLTRLLRPVATVQAWLDDIEAVGLIVRYEANGDKFLCVPDFSDKQPYLNRDREAKTTIPPPTQEQLTSSSRPLHDLCAAKVKVKEKVKEKENSTITKEFEQEFWPNVPNKIGKGKARESYILVRSKFSKEVILAGLPNYVEYEKGRKAACNENRAYQPLHPTTWLNQERWADEPAGKRSQSSVCDFCGGVSVGQVERAKYCGKDDCRRKAFS